MNEIRTLSTFEVTLLEAVLNKAMEVGDARTEYIFNTALGKITRVIGNRLSLGEARRQALKLLPVLVSRGVVSAKFRTCRSLPNGCDVKLTSEPCSVEVRELQLCCS